MYETDLMHVTLLLLRNKQFVNSSNVLILKIMKQLAFLKEYNNSEIFDL